MTTKSTEPRFDRAAMQAALAAFDALYAEYGKRVYRFCFRLTGRRADAEDLAQEVFLAAYQGRGGFEGRSTVLTWLYRIAIYRWRRMRDARGPQTAPLDEQLTADTGTTDPARIGLARMSLDRALDALPSDLRDAFVLVKAEGLKYREAADVLGIPQGTIQSRVHDAVCRLRTLLRDEENAKP